MGEHRARRVCLTRLTGKTFVVLALVVLLIQQGWAGSPNKAASEKSAHASGKSAHASGKSAHASGKGAAATVEADGIDQSSTPSALGAEVLASGNGGGSVGAAPASVSGLPSPPDLVSQFSSPSDAARPSLDLTAALRVQASSQPSDISLIPLSLLPNSLRPSGRALPPANPLSRDPAVSRGSLAPAQIAGKPGGDRGAPIGGTGNGGLTTAGGPRERAAPSDGVAGNGESGIDLEENLDLGTAGTFATQHRSMKYEDPGDRRFGGTSDETVHRLTLEMGSATQLEARSASRAASGDVYTGGLDQKARDSSVKFSSQFGPDKRSNLVLALSTQQQEVKTGRQARSSQEAHLKLAATKALALQADYVKKSAQMGGDQTVSTFGTALQLAPKSDLYLSWRKTDQGGERRSQESTMRLKLGLGGGASAANLTAQRIVVRTGEAGPLTRLSCAFGGNLGRGANQTNMTLNFKEERGDQTVGIQSRMLAFHLDRQLGPRLKLTSDHAQQLRQSNGENVSLINSDHRLEAQAGRNTILSAVLGWITDPGSIPRRTKEISVEHTMGKASAEAYQQFWVDDESSGAISGLIVDVPVGRLPKWATRMSRTHKFKDANQYLVPEEIQWEDLDFSGYRLELKRRVGGVDDGLNTLTLIHRRVVANRYHLLALYQQCPESERGLDEGRPLLVGRELLELGTPVREDLSALLRLTREPSTSSAEFGGRSLALGIVGKLSEQEEVEASIGREAEQWDDFASRRTRLTLMYARRLDEERQLSLKLGYAWGEEGELGSVREYRFQMAYVNPI